MSNQINRRDFLSGTALVIAASFAAGLNIYATVLTLGILARTLQRAAAQ